MGIHIEVDRRLHYLPQVKESRGGDEGLKFEVEVDKQAFGFKDGFLYIDQPDAIMKRVETWQRLRAQSKEFEPYLVTHCQVVTLPEFGDGMLGLLCSDLTEGKVMEVSDYSELVYTQPPLFKEAARWLNQMKREVPNQSLPLMDVVFETNVLRLANLLDEHGWRVTVDTFFLGVEKVSDRYDPYIRHIFLGDLGPHISAAGREPYQNLYGQVWDMISFSMYGEY